MTQKRHPKGSPQGGQYTSAAQAKQQSSAPLSLEHKHTLISAENGFACSCGNTDLYVGDNDGAFPEVEGHAMAYLCLAGEGGSRRIGIHDYRDNTIRDTDRTVLGTYTR